VTGNVDPKRTEVLADDVVVQRNVMVAMRDGVRLATDVYRPARAGQVLDGPRAVILERTPYDRSATSRSEVSVARAEPMTRVELGVRLVREGYVAIVQDCRGRYGSEGVFVKYLAEGEDGVDTLAWIVAQPWSDGRVATMGLSYAAHTQMALACLDPPGLACMVLDSGGFSNAFTCGIRQGGAFELKQATWAYNRAAESPLAQRDPRVRAAIEAEDLHGWFERMPWTRGRSPVRWDPDYEHYLLEQWQHGTFDDYWKKVGLWAEGYRDGFPRVPIAFVSSWYDAYVQSTLENYTALRDDAGGRPAALVMGPWTHGDRSESVFGDVDVGPRATFDGQVDEDWLTWRLRWFARWLKADDGERVDGAQAGRVHLFLMGGGAGRRTADGHLDHAGEWIETADWPPPGGLKVVLHLRADMTLSKEPAAEDGSLSYDFDPARPVPTIGGSLTSGEPVFSGGGFDQVERAAVFGCVTLGMPLSSRRDVLSFETPPLPEAVAIVGEVRVCLNVSTDAPDTDFTAKLVDVYPPSEDYPRGYALNITDGIFRVRYRNGFDRPELVAPDEGVFEIEIRPFATANLFAQGHRIRLDISSSNFPKYDVNPNTGEPEGTSRRGRVACNTVHVGPLLGSCVELMQITPSGR